MNGMERPELTLHVLNTNYSSWSLRPRILMDFYQIPYKLVMYYKDQKDSLAALHQYSPTGLVPLLQLSNADVKITDSLAICETIAEMYPEFPILPRDPIERALCRSVCAEMHSSFGHIREKMSMNLSIVPEMMKPIQWDEATLKQVERVSQVWTECRSRTIELAKRTGVQDHGFLFNEFSIADAMYAPVVTRFVSYGHVHRLSPLAKEYHENVMTMDCLRKVYEEGREEYKTHRIIAYEQMYEWA